MQRIDTEIEIAAPPDRVWEVLTDFARYPEWNPFFVQASGVAEEGASLALSTKLFSAKSKARTFKVKVFTARPHAELHWGGGLAIPKLADGVHSYVLTPRNGGTHFHHYERLSGLITPFVGRLIKILDRRYHEVNAALKARSETPGVKLSGG